MSRPVSACLLLAGMLFFDSGCDSKLDPVAGGRDAVKEVVKQPFNALEGAKESLSKTDDKTKAAIEELDKESKQP